MRMHECAQFVAWIDTFKQTRQSSGCILILQGTHVIERRILVACSSTIYKKIKFFKNKRFLIVLADDQIIWSSFNGNVPTNTSVCLSISQSRMSSDDEFLLLEASAILLKNKNYKRKNYGKNLEWCNFCIIFKEIFIFSKMFLNF